MKYKKLFMALYWSLFVVLIIISQQYDKIKKDDTPEVVSTTVRTRHTSDFSSTVINNDLQYNMLGSDKRLSTKNQQLIFDYCNSLGLDTYFILAVALTESNGYMYNLFKLEGMNGKDQRLQISHFLVKSGLIDTNIPYNILQENEKVKLKKPYLKAYTDLYGKKNLTRLYNNYYLIASKHLE